VGLVLTVGGLVALAMQMPAGALVDAVRARRAVAALAIVAICLSALAPILWPSFSVVVASRIVHAIASSVLGPLIVALSLSLAGYTAFGNRLGRNARFAALGNGVAAGVMGAAGYYITAQAPFLLTVALAVPALLALTYIPAGDADVRAERRAAAPAARIGAVLLDRRLMVFACCVLLFQLANAALLPLVGSAFAVRSSSLAAGLVGACIVIPQLVVAACAPLVGRLADTWGRRPLLLLCFAALASRAVLLALTSNPSIVLAAQALDGICASVLAVAIPLVVADIIGGSGRFNLGLGVIGSAVGIGAALSTTLAGWMFDHFGSAAAFAGLAGLAVVGLIFVLLCIQETRTDADGAAGQTSASLSGA
jgi:MFS family permease